MIQRRFLIVPLMLLIVAGCGEPQREEDLASEKPQIALVMKSRANEFFKTMEQGARDYHQARADKFDLIVNGMEDIGGQVSLVEQMIARQVDAIVIAPADSKALVSVLERAVNSGITVVNIDNKLNDEVLAERQLRIPFVGPDNRKGARRAGEHLVTRLSQGSQVAIIGGIPSAFNAIQRRLGFEDAMNAAGMSVVASQSGNWEMAKANQVASGIINKHPNLKAILCANDSMALGVVAALAAAGRSGEVLVVAYDNITAVQDLMKKGRVLCTIDQHADQPAVYGIQYALEIARGEAAPEDRETPVDLIRGSCAVVWNQDAAIPGERLCLVWRPHWSCICRSHRPPLCGRSKRGYRFRVGSDSGCRDRRHKPYGWARFRLALGVGLAGVALGLTGFQEGATQQSDTTVFWIRAIYAFMRGGGFLVSFAVLLRFPLTPERVAEIRNLLDDRRASILRGGNHTGSSPESMS